MNTSGTLISVIVPSYKPQDYLWECLDSLVTQSFDCEKYEIILVLNGCCEPYNTKILEYVSKVSYNIHFNYIQIDKGGVSNARNIGLKSAKGEYICFIDDDDYVSSCYLEELYSKASRDTISLSYPLCFEDGTTNFEPYRITKDYDACYSKGVQDFKNAKKFFSGPVYKLIHKDIICGRQFDTRLKNGEDSLFMFAISDKISKIDFTSKDSIYYRRIRNNSAVYSQDFLYKLKNSITLFVKYNRIYWCSPFKYDFSFFVTRLLGTIHRLMV